MGGEPDFSTLDGPLVAACQTTASDQRSLSVFLHAALPVTPEQAATLTALGVKVPSIPKRILTATLSPAQVEQLSHEPWIQRIKLSHRLKMLDESQ
ncbi:MAG: hypothetical protein U1A77_26145 [Pirellulales bacterium]